MSFYVLSLSVSSESKTNSRPDQVSPETPARLKDLERGGGEGGCSRNVFAMLLQTYHDKQ